MATSFSKQIAATADDGRNTAPATGADTFASTSLYIGLVGAGYKQSAMGLRFNSVTVPQGATILSASIQLTPKETDADVDKTCKIYGVDIDDAAAWSDTNLPNDAGDAPDNTATRTTAKTDWTLPAISYSAATTTPTAATSVLYPGTGAGTSWTNPSYIGVDDGNYATINAINVTSMLYGTNYGFNIPTGATINGIKVEIEVKSSSGGNSNFSTTTGHLTKDGTNPAGSTASSNWNLTTSDVIYVWGSASNLWGTTWTAEEINASGFGTYFSFSNSSGMIATFSVDFYRITVYYTYDAPVAEAVYPISTPDISPVVKEIVDRAGWTPGNDMAFAIVPDTGATAWAKEFFDYTASATYAATLSIAYTSATYSSRLSAILFSEDEKAHICIAGNSYALGRLSPSYPLALAGTITQELTDVEQVAQMGILTFVAGSDGVTHPVFAKTSLTYINTYGQMTIETPVVEGKFEGIRIHFGTDLALNSATLSDWIQVYTKSDNESSWSSAIDLVAENSEQYIEGVVSTNKNFQAKIVIDPIDSSTPNKITNIEIY
jgi:hypothetical protein